MDGGSIAGTIFIVFLVLKLLHKITWSWWWVTSPLWIDAAATIALVLMLSFFGLSAFGIIRLLRHGRR
jgi:hypothetical protein